MRLNNLAAKFDDEVSELRETGVQAAFNIYNEAATRFVEHAAEKLSDAETLHREKG